MFCQTGKATMPVRPSFKMFRLPFLTENMRSKLKAGLKLIILKARTYWLLSTVNYCSSMVSWLPGEDELSQPLRLCRSAARRPFLYVVLLFLFKHILCGSYICISVCFQLIARMCFSLFGAGFLKVAHLMLFPNAFYLPFFSYFLSHAFSVSFSACGALAYTRQFWGQPFSLFVLDSLI